jgi:hypothetical protein
MVWRKRNGIRQQFLEHQAFQVCPTDKSVTAPYRYASEMYVRSLFTFSRVPFRYTRKRRPVYLFAFVAVTHRRVLISTASSNAHLSQCEFTWKPVQDLHTLPSYSPPQQNTCPLVNRLWTLILQYPSCFPAISTVSTGPTATTVFIYIKVSIFLVRVSSHLAQPSKNRMDGSDSVFKECPEVWALHGPYTTHIQQAGAHAVGDTVTESFIARYVAGILFIARLAVQP